MFSLLAPTERIERVAQLGNHPVSQHPAVGVISITNCKGEPKPFALNARRHAAGGTPTSRWLLVRFKLAFLTFRPLALQ